MSAEIERKFSHIGQHFSTHCPFEGSPVLGCGAATAFPSAASQSHVLPLTNFKHPGTCSTLWLSVVGDAYSQWCMVSKRSDFCDGHCDGQLTVSGLGTPPPPPAPRPPPCRGGWGWGDCMAWQRVNVSWLFAVKSASECQHVPYDLSSTETAVLHCIIAKH